MLNTKSSYFLKKSLEMMGVRAQMWIILFISAISTAVKIEADNSTSHLIPCKEGWYLFGEKCYKVFGQRNPLSWTKAAESCVALGGHLASIHTIELQDLLTSLLVLEKEVAMWIGLKGETKYEGLHGGEHITEIGQYDPILHDESHKQEVVYKYEWHDGSIVNYTNWIQCEPSAEAGDPVSCVIMVLGHKNKAIWNPIKCESTEPYVCQSHKSKETDRSDPRFCALEKDGGWKYLNSCYHIVTEDESWDDAEKYCHQNLDGHLVSILNNKNNIFLSCILSSADLDLWIGVKMRDHEVQKWSSGWHVAFNTWDDDQEFTKGKCGLRTKYGHWISVDCAEKHPFVCEVSSNKPPVYEQGREGWKCPDSSKDWKDLGGDTCYIFETEQSVGWYEANYACTTKGGGLASIRSEVESQILHYHVLDTQERLLIGLHRKLDNKTAFQWMDGSEVNFDNWYPGEPNTIGEECGELFTHSMQWNDISCDEKKGYICSAKKLPPILYDENYEEPLSQYDNQSERCDCPGNLTEPLPQVVIKEEKCDPPGNLTETLPQHDIKVEKSDHPGNLTEPLPQQDIKEKKCDPPSDITAQTVLITMVCSFSVMILIGIMAYFYRTRIAKDIQFSLLHNVVFNRP